MDLPRKAMIADLGKKINDFSKELSQLTIDSETLKRDIHSYYCKKCMPGKLCKIKGFIKFLKKLQKDLSLLYTLLHEDDSKTHNNLTTIPEISEEL